MKPLFSGHECIVMMNVIRFTFVISAVALCAMISFSTLRQLEGSSSIALFEFASRKASVTGSLKTLSYMPRSLMTSKFELAASIRNGWKLHGNKLLEADVAKFWAIVEVVPGNESLSTNTKSPGQKVGVLQTWLLYADLYRFCFLTGRHL